MSRKASVATQGKIYISYSPQRRKESVRKLADYFKEQNWTIWLDTTNMTSSMQDEISKQGIDAADAVVICVSDEYKTMKNCQKEAEYASKQKKLIIPLKMHKDVKTNDWIGFVIGDRPWVDFTEDTQLDRVIMTIEQAIQQNKR